MCIVHRFKEKVLHVLIQFWWRIHKELIHFRTNRTIRRWGLTSDLIRKMRGSSGTTMRHVIKDLGGLHTAEIEFSILKKNHIINLNRLTFPVRLHFLSVALLKWLSTRNTGKCHLWLRLPCSPTSARCHERHLSWTPVGFEMRCQTTSHGERTL